MRRVVVFFSPLVMVLAVVYMAAVPAAADSTVMKAVLRNEAELFSVKHDRSMTLDEFLSLGGDQGPYMGREMCRYTVINMDQDGAPEVVLDAGDVIVLHYSGGIVYAFAFDARSMQQIRMNGTYHASNGASSGAYHRIKFHGKTYEVEALAEYDELEGIYRIEEENVSKEDFDRILAGSITWDDEIYLSDLTREDIDKWSDWRAEGNSYADISDIGFPVPMLNGAAIPYKFVSLPYEGYEVTSFVYPYSESGFMESYKKQLREAGFVDQGGGGHIESLWRYDRSADRASLIVELTYEDAKFVINMYVNHGLF